MLKNINFPEHLPFKSFLLRRIFDSTTRHANVVTRQILRHRRKQNAHLNNLRSDTRCFTEFTVVFITGENKQTTWLTKAEACPIHKHDEIPEILCTRHKVSLWHSTKRAVTKQYQIKFLSLKGHRMTPWVCSFRQIQSGFLIYRILFKEGFNWIWNAWI